MGRPALVFFWDKTVPDTAYDLELDTLPPFSWMRPGVPGPTTLDTWIDPSAIGEQPPSVQAQQNPALKAHLAQFDTDPISQSLAESQFYEQQYQALKEKRRKEEADIEAQYDDPVSGALAASQFRQREDTRMDIAERQRLLDEPARQNRIRQYVKTGDVTGNAFVDEPLAAAGRAGGTFLSMAARAAEAVAPTGLPLGRQAADEINRTVDELREADAINRENDMWPWLSRMYGEGAQTVMEAVAVPGGASAKISSGALNTANRAITEGSDAGLSGGKLVGHSLSQGGLEALISSVLAAKGMGGLESRLAGQQAAATTFKELRRGFLKDYRNEALLEEVPTEQMQSLSSYLFGVTPAQSPTEIAQGVVDTLGQTLFATAGAHAPNAASLGLSKAGQALQTASLTPEQRVIRRRMAAGEQPQASHVPETFVAESREAAVQKAKEALGDDAFIVSNKRHAASTKQEPKYVVKAVRKAQPQPTATEATTAAEDVIPPVPTVTPTTEGQVIPSVPEEELQQQGRQIDQGVLTPDSTPPEASTDRMPTAMTATPAATGTESESSAAGTPITGTAAAAGEQEAPTQTAAVPLLPPATAQDIGFRFEGGLWHSYDKRNGRDITIGHKDRSESVRVDDALQYDASRYQRELKRLQDDARIAASGISKNERHYLRNLGHKAAAIEAMTPQDVSAIFAKEDAADPSFPVQRRIDTLEDELEARGVDIALLVDPDSSHAADLIAGGWRAMPENLARLYRERNAIYEEQKRKGIDAIRSALNLPNSLATRVLDKVGIHEDNTPYDNIRAFDRLAVDPHKRVESIAFAVAFDKGDERQRRIDDVDDLTREEWETARDIYETLIRFKHGPDADRVLGNIRELYAKSPTSKASLNLLGAGAVHNEPSFAPAPSPIPTETPNALEIPSAETADASSRPQPEVREKGGSTPVGGERVQQGGPNAPAAGTGGALPNVQWPADDSFDIGAFGAEPEATTVPAGEAEAVAETPLPPIEKGRYYNVRGPDGKPELTANGYPVRRRVMDVKDNGDARAAGKWYTPAEFWKDHFPKESAAAQTLPPIQEEPEESDVLTPKQPAAPVTEKQAALAAKIAERKQAAAKKKKPGKRVRVDKAAKTPTAPKSGLGRMADAARAESPELQQSDAPEAVPLSAEELDNAVLDAVDEAVADGVRTFEAFVHQVADQTGAAFAKKHETLLSDAWAAMRQSDPKLGLDSPAPLGPILEAWQAKQEPDREYSVPNLMWAFDLSRDDAETINDLLKAMAFPTDNLRLGRGGPLATGELLHVNGGAVKGAARLINGSQVLIRGLKSPDATTALHELWHAFELLLLDRNAPLRDQVGITDDEIEVYRKWTGMNKAVTKEEKRAAFEKGARGWENFLSKGKAPVSGLSSLFGKIAQFFSRIYNGIKGTPLDVRPTQAVNYFFGKVVMRAEALRVKEALNQPREVSPELSGLANEVVDAIRALRGDPRIPATEQEGWYEWLQSAARTMAGDPEYAANLVKMLNTEPRAIDHKEHAALNLYYRQMQNSFDEKLHAVEQARLHGDIVALLTAQGNADSVSEVLNYIEQAARTAGTMWGRAGVARQMLLRSDFSAEMIARRIRNAGGNQKHDAAARKEIDDWAEEVGERHAKAQSDYDAAVEKKEAADREEAVKETVADHVVKNKRLKAERAREAAARFRKAANITTYELPGVGEEHEAAMDWLRVVREPKMTFDDAMQIVGKEFGPKHAANNRAVFQAAWNATDAQSSDDILSRINPKDAHSIRIGAKALMRRAIQDGNDNYQSVTDAVEADLQQIPELAQITRAEVMDAISGRGRFAPQTKKEAQIDSRKMLTILQKLRELEQLHESGKYWADTAKGKTPTPNPVAQTLERDIKDYMRKHGIVDTNRLAALEETKKRQLLAEIDELTAAINSKTQIVKEKQDQPDWSAEVRSLIEQRDNAKREYHELFGDAEDLTRREEAAERNAERWEQRVRDLEVESRKSPQDKPTSERLESARHRALAARKDLARWREAEIPEADKQRDKEAKILKRMEAAAEKRLARLKELNAKGEIPGPRGKTTITSERLADLRRQIQAAEAEQKYLKAWEKEGHAEADWAKRQMQQMQKRMESLQLQLETNNFDTPPRTQRRWKPTQEMTTMRLALDKVEAEVAAEVEKRRKANRTSREAWAERFGFLTNTLPRTLGLGLDLSSLMIQGGWYHLAHPVKFARTAALGAMSVFSERTANQVIQELEQREGYTSGRYRRHGIEIHGHLAGVDTIGPETKIPLFRQAQRGASTILALLQADVSDTFHQALSHNTGDLTQDQEDFIKSAVHSIVGIPNKETDNLIGQAAKIVFLAPTWTLSRWKMAGGWTMLRSLRFKDVSMKDRAKIAFHLYGGPLLGYMAMYALMRALHLAFDDPEDDRPFWVTDWRDKNFGSFLFNGKYWNFTAGISDVLSFANRMYYGQQVDAYGAASQRDRTDTMAQYFSNKLGPAARMAALAWQGATSYQDTGEARFRSGMGMFEPSVVMGINMPGVATLPLHVLEENYVPATIKDLVKAWKQGGADAAMASFVGSVPGIRSREVVPFIEPWGPQTGDFEPYNVIRRWNTSEAVNKSTRDDIDPFIPEPPERSRNVPGDNTKKGVPWTAAEYRELVNLTAAYAEQEWWNLRLGIPGDPKSQLLTDEEIKKPTAVTIARLKESLARAKARARKDVEGN